MHFARLLGGFQLSNGMSVALQEFIKSKGSGAADCLGHQVPSTTTRVVVLAALSFLRRRSALGREFALLGLASFSHEHSRTNHGNPF